MPSHPPTTSVFSPHTLFHLLGVCLAYFESKFNPSAVYENSRDGSTGFGLFQIRDNEWCDHGKNLCSVSCTGGSLSLQSLGGGRGRSLQNLHVWRRQGEGTGCV